MRGKQHPDFFVLNFGKGIQTNTLERKALPRTYSETNHLWCPQDFMIIVSMAAEDMLRIGIVLSRRGLAVWSRALPTGYQPV